MHRHFNFHAACHGLLCWSSHSSTTTTTITTAAAAQCTICNHLPTGGRSSYTDMQERSRAGHVTQAVAMVVVTFCVNLSTHLSTPSENASNTGESKLLTGVYARAGATRENTNLVSLVPLNKRGPVCSRSAAHLC